MKESPNINLNTDESLVCEKYGILNQWGKGDLINKWCWNYQIRKNQNPILHRDQKPI